MTEPFNEENDVFVDLTFDSGSEAFHMTRHNSSLYTFFGNVAIHGALVRASEFNHIFLLREKKEDGTSAGSYIFAQSPVFAKLAGFMLQYDFPAELNQNEVPEGDQDAWERAQTQDIHDYIPDDFFKK